MLRCRVVPLSKPNAFRVGSNRLENLFFTVCRNKQVLKTEEVSVSYLVVISPLPPLIYRVAYGDPDWDDNVLDWLTKVESNVGDINCQVFLITGSLRVTYQSFGMFKLATITETDNPLSCRRSSNWSNFSIKSKTDLVFDPPRKRFHLDDASICLIRPSSESMRLQLPQELLGCFVFPATTPAGPFCIALVTQTHCGLATCRFR